MGGENAQGNGVGFPCWLIYIDLFDPDDREAYEVAASKVKAMFGVQHVKVPKRMYLLFNALGGTEMQERRLASRFDSQEAAEGRLVYLCGENPDSIGKLGVEKWDGK